jgi:hypothetical protein
MKKLFIISFLCMTQIVNAQTTKKETTNKNIVKTTNPKAPADFKKTLLPGDSVYNFKGTVMIKNGHGEKVKVFFTGSVDKNKWEELKKSKNYSDYDAFNLVASILSVNAQYKLKNTQSFSPLSDQFFMWSNDTNSFISNYKMMGRNGFGNLTESTALVEYNPFND